MATMVSSNFDGAIAWWPNFHLLMALMGLMGKLTGPAECFWQHQLKLAVLWCFVLEVANAELSVPSVFTRCFACKVGFKDQIGPGWNGHWPQGGFKLNFLFELLGRVWARLDLFEKELGVRGSTALDQFRPVWTSWDGLWTRHIGLLDFIKTSLTV